MKTRKKLVASRSIASALASEQRRRSETFCVRGAAVGFFPRFTALGTGAFPFSATGSGNAPFESRKKILPQKNIP